MLLLPDKEIDYISQIKNKYCIDDLETQSNVKGHYFVILQFE